MACATAPRSGGRRDLGAAADRPLPAFERRVDAFVARDSAGAAYEFPFLGGFNVPRPQLVDIDGDGDDDLFVQEASGAIALFENAGVTGETRFEWRTDRFRDLDVGEWFRFADIDGDGDADLLSESRYSMIRIWENVGGATDARFVVLADTLRDVSGAPIFSDRQSIPNILDLDCDERLDLLLGRLDGTVTRYEAIGDAVDEAPRFEHVTDRWEGIEIVAQITPSARHGANTLVFHDADRDGDPDLFWGDFFEPGVLLIENVGTCERPSFRSRPRPFPPEDPISTSGYNASAFGDLDGDGRIDLLVGVLGGAYNAIATAAENLYRLERGPGGWELLSRRFLGQIDVGASSVPAAGDLDADGDADLLLANKIEPSDPRTARVYLFENVGGPGRPELRKRAPLPIEGAFHYAPALADLDADGDLDLVVGTWNRGILLHRNEGGPGGASFDPGADTLLTLSRGSHASPALGDLDGDGDLDLIAGESSGELNLWRNDGTAAEPRFVLVSDTLAGFDAGRRSAPALADLDGDGDLDVLVGSEDGEARVLWNVGGTDADGFAPGAASLTLPLQAAPAFADLDDDGDPDLLLGEVAGGLRYYENAGASRAAP